MADLNPATRLMASPRPEENNQAQRNQLAEPMEGMRLKIGSTPWIHSCWDLKNIAVKKSIESQKINNLGMKHGGGRVTWTAVKTCP